MKKLFYTMLALLFVAAPTYAVQVLIQPGDTLSEIALLNSTTVDALANLNGIKNPDLIYAGQTLETGDLLGASIPTVIALYTDSLASRMSNSASSFTLVRGTDKQSRALAGFYGFVIDEGTNSEEFITANCTATACTVVTRGVDVQDGETSVSALKFEHRRGATVKISNFPQLAILSRILNGDESASSTFMIGDGATTQDKKLIAYNGDADLPFLQYNEADSQWQFSDDGVTTISFSAAIVGGLTASSTKGIAISDSKILINASTTGALAFDSDDGSLYVSPTFNHPATFNDTATFNSSISTSPDNLQLAGFADSALDAMNRQSTDLRILTGTATGTAKLAVTSGRALWVSSTSTLAHTNTSAASSTYQFIGIALNSAAISEDVTYARPGETACNLSGLSPGMSYYLNGTDGEISTTPGTYHAKIGRAISSTCLQVIEPKYIATGTTAQITATGDTNVTVGFYPARIEIVAKTAAVGAGYGTDQNISISNRTNGESSVTKAWNFLQDVSNRSIGTISAKSATGFTLNCSAIDGAGYYTTIYWTAYSE